MFFSFNYIMYIFKNLKIKTNYFTNILLVIIKRYVDSCKCLDCT